MCGIVGLRLKNPDLHPRLGELVVPMLDVLASRGPDSTGAAIYRHDVPAGSLKYSLGQSPAYPHQAMRFGDAAYAVQFHVEVTDPMFAEWRHVPAYAAAAEAALGASGFDRLAWAFAESRQAMAESADRMFHAWLCRTGIHCSETQLTDGNRPHPGAAA